MIYKIENTAAVKKLFSGWNETIIWSCLDNVMGCIYADHPKNPNSAAAYLGDFCFLAGLANEELALNYTKDFIIMVPQNEQWSEIISESFGENAKRITRYAFKKEKNIFDLNKLSQAVLSLPDGYSLKMIDEHIFGLCSSSAWSRDLVSQYENYEMYKRLGIGAVILKDGQPVSGASSYSTYIGGIEIEIDTKEDHRRKGLAYICGARLILECAKRGLYPGWDAHNMASVRLAEKLGYHFDREYTAFEVYK